MKLPPGHVPGVGLQQATAYGGLGEKLLKQYGWKEGQGLGVQGTGIKSAIKVLKKDDTIGVGGRQVVRENNTAKWWQQSFDSALKNVSEAVSGNDSSDSDADEFDLSEQRCNRDGTVASGTAAELRLERELAKDPWGRFGGRNGKLARIRAQENALLAAQQGKVEINVERPSSLDRPIKKRKLEVPLPQSTANLTAPAKELKTQKSVKSSSAQPLVEQQPILPSSKEKPTKNKLKTKLKGKSTEGPRKTPAKAAPGDQLKEAPSLDPETELHRGQEIKDRAGPALQSPVRPADWWGAKKFVTGGCLGGLNDQETSKSRKSFTEDTQEQLYLTSQAAKTAGKKGLGAGQGKAIGHDWQGKKTVFEDGEPLAKLQAEAQSLEDHSNGQLAVPEQHSGVLEHKLSTKTLAKLSRQILKKEAGNQLKLSKLLKRLSKQLPEGQHASVSRKDLICQIAACPRLITEGKVVRLARKMPSQ